MKNVFEMIPYFSNLPLWLQVSWAFWAFAGVILLILSLSKYKEPVQAKTDQPHGCNKV
jgi:hypothetical protein